MEPSFPPLPQFSAPHSFRLGVPSYVYPADILPNIEALAPFVDDIELVLFESREADDRGRTADAGRQTPDDGKQKERKEASGEGERTENAISNIPTPDTIRRLAELAQQHDLTYTVHFPIDRHLGSPDAKERQALQKQMLAIMDRTRSLRPHAYILHLEGVSRDSDPARVQTWQCDIAAMLPALIENAGDPALLCVENLNYPFAWCEPLLDRFGLGVCTDVGHLWLGKDDVEAHLQRHLPRTRVIHLHGVRDGHDHLSLTALPPSRRRPLLNAIDKFTGVLTLEIFNYEEVRDSVAELSKFLNCKPGKLS